MFGLGKRQDPPPLTKVTSKGHKKAGASFSKGPSGVSKSRFEGVRKRSATVNSTNPTASPSRYVVTCFFSFSSGPALRVRCAHVCLTERPPLAT